MTTGRINQVTILYPHDIHRDVAWKAPQRRRNCATRKGPTKSGSNPRHSSQQVVKSSQEAIQLPPLSFPRDGPLRQRSGPESRHASQHTPLKWRVPNSSHTQRRLPVRAFPRRSERDSSHWPAIHRPQDCLLPKGGGLLFPLRAPSGAGIRT